MNMVLAFHPALRFDIVCKKYSSFLSKEFLHLHMTVFLHANRLILYICRLENTACELHQLYYVYCIHFRGTVHKCMRTCSSFVTQEHAVLTIANRFDVTICQKTSTYSYDHFL